MKTQKEIFAAADAILAEGGSPTVATVRAKLGSGSYSTIGPALKLWRAEQAEKQPKETTPPPVPETVTAHAKALWDEALSLARAGLQAERERLAMERREIERERQEAGELADQLEAELDEARARIVRLEGADRRLEDLKAEHSKALDELAGARVRVEIEKESRDMWQKQAEQSRKDAETARVREQACLSRLEQAGREVESWKERAKLAESSIEDERTARNNAVADAARVRGRLAVYEGRSMSEPQRQKPKVELPPVEAVSVPTEQHEQTAEIPGPDEFCEKAYKALISTALEGKMFTSALNSANIATLREALTDESVEPARLNRIKVRLQEAVKAKAAELPTLNDLMRASPVPAQADITSDQDAD